MAASEEGREKRKKEFGKHIEVLGTNRKSITKGKVRRHLVIYIIYKIYALLLNVLSV